MSQQTVTVGVDSTPTTPPSFSIEVEEQVFKRLSDLANKERLSITVLTSQLLKVFLTLHKREVRQLIENIKKRAFR
jgi:predicted transcriptional regulator